MLKNLEMHGWNATYAKLLQGVCKAILVERDGRALIVCIITIGKHGATDGFNTCFVDVLATLGENMEVVKALKAGLECLDLVASQNRCDGLLADTPNKKLADIAKTLGFKVTPMFKLGRLINVRE